MKRAIRRTLLHYLLGMVLLAIYGVQVCPFLDSLNPAQLLIPILVVFTGLFLIRLTNQTRIDTTTLKRRVKRQFTTDLTLFASGGALLALFNTVTFDFPLLSGIKVLAGMLILGFMIACELALDQEYRLAQTIAVTGEQIAPDSNPYPLSKKFSGFAIVCALSVIGVVFLVINKDLEWLQGPGADIPHQLSQRYILLEISFVVTVMMGYVLAIILGYSRNLRYFLNNQSRTLLQVTGGALDTQVPVTSNDEFGLIAARTNQMIKGLAQRTAELHLTRDVSILGLASLAETRDNETGAHILRTQHYVRLLAEQLQTTAGFEILQNAETIELLFKSAPLHDVGKVGIPDHILLKPGKLTEEEFAIMKRHAQIGADALAVAADQLGSNSFLRFAREISLTHHEKWDGTGYPNGLKAQEIPVSGRLMALADVYDALRSRRVYKPPFNHNEAKTILLEGKGRHFDPDVVDAFIAREADFIEIAHRYQDRRAPAAITTAAATTRLASTSCDGADKLQNHPPESVG
ncbi:HD domain-containing phosphohydrolase [Sedimenticola sp.]|uniref:HD domain-containing phosphohydrolase n=1 Tax=Sedimenticola sp. TaxID=1940285 RepID=UPI003D0FDA21